MVLSGFRKNGFTRDELLFLTGDVKQTASSQNEIDLIRFGVAVDALILSRFQAIKITEIFLGFKYGQFLHFFIRKTNEIVNPSNFHSRVRLIVVEPAQEERTKFRNSVPELDQ